MKVIELLNRIANGEEVPKKIRIDHWCYKFEWKDYAGNYVDEHENIDLMSALSCDKEELNYEIHELEEPKGIPEKLRTWYSVEEHQSLKQNCEFANCNFETMYEKINEIIDYLESKGE